MKPKWVNIREKAKIQKKQFQKLNESRLHFPQKYIEFKTEKKHYWNRAVVDKYGFSQNEIIYHDRENRLKTEIAKINLKQKNSQLSLRNKTVEQYISVPPQNLERPLKISTMNRNIQTDRSFTKNQKISLPSIKIQKNAEKPKLNFDYQAYFSSKARGISPTYLSSLGNPFFLIDQVQK